MDQSSLFSSDPLPSGDRPMTDLKSRSELLFLYDASWINPNGDPLDENKPRIDEETSKNIVSDVRLKRTIRDYLHEYKNQEILIREIVNNDGTIQDGKARAKDFLDPKNKLKPEDQKKYVEAKVLESCIDTRLFGCTLPLEKDSVTLTGPVQFNMGVSLHRVRLEFIKGTAAFAADKGSKQKSFREEYLLPYSLISFYGVINEKAAEKTGLQETDIALLLEGLWLGTKNLISRSKVGQEPRLLLRVEYQQGGFHLGELHKRLRFVSDKRDEEIRDVADGRLEIGPLLSALTAVKDKLLRFHLASDPRLSFLLDGQPLSSTDLSSTLTALAPVVALRW